LWPADSCLGDTLDTERVAASCIAAFLTLRIPIAEQAKPRKVTISSNGHSQDRQAINV
jgi:HSP20 family protein